MAMKDQVSKREAAAFFGVSVQALDGWFNGGCPIAEEAADGSIKALSLSAMARWRINRSSKPVIFQPNADEILPFFKELVGNQLLPKFCSTFLREGIGLFVQPEYGFTKERAMKLALHVIYLNHIAAGKFFGDEKTFEVDYPDIVMEAMKASKAKKMGEWLAKYWPDR